jgi:hypothetical protein
MPAFYYARHAEEAIPLRRRSKHATSSAVVPKRRSRTLQCASGEFTGYSLNAVIEAAVPLRIADNPNGSGRNFPQFDFSPASQSATVRDMDESI